MMSRVVLVRARSNTSAHSVAGVLQNYTGLSLPEAMRVLERVQSGERVHLDLDDEFDAYDLASMLSDLGIQSEIADAT